MGRASARSEGSCHRGEAGKENGPVDRSPAERARQGWQALGFQAELEAQPESGASQFNTLDRFFNSLNDV